MWDLLGTIAKIIGYILYFAVIAGGFAWVGEMIWLSLQESIHPERFKGPESIKVEHDD